MSNLATYSNIILEKLSNNKKQLKEQFNNSAFEVGVRYFFIDDLLPDDIAIKIYNQFPISSSMRLMNSIREKKYTTKDFNKFHPILKDITFAFQEKTIVKLVEEITGIMNQVPDDKLYAGGLSLMKKDNLLNPHIDNSHDGDRKLYRTLNLLYYVTPNLSETDGGSLELWDEKVQNRIQVVSKFNRLIVMETNPTSWHSVSKVKADIHRTCVSNYYFSEYSPTNISYSNVTTFSARPEQPFLRAFFYIDNILRSSVRKFIPSGLGRKDIYSAKD